MSTIDTILELSSNANKGANFRDKLVAFLVAGLTAMGFYRVKLRQWWIKWINNFAEKDFVQIRLYIQNKLIYFCMRQGNEADYLIGGELVRGGYEVPNFIPKSIIDGGANIGMFAVHAASYFPEAKLICYEPDTTNFQLLQKNLALNNLLVGIHPLGLWSKNTTLYYHAQSSHTGFINEEPPGVPIPCTLPEIESDCWLKLDIEGGEYEVLPAILNKGQYPRWISLEIHEFDTKGESLISLLREHGYTIKGGEDATVNCTVISAYRN
ncbi:FkbM family methyltransferase [Nostoc sp.]|uniref:FkbM family methyltransferase n=1 Tax=Nostoc sp. TaxID=1180 RepID=UPI002FF50749